VILVKMKTFIYLNSLIKMLNKVWSFGWCL